MGAQNFNFAPKFHQIGDLQPQTLYFWKKIFQQDRLKFREMHLSPPPSPLASTKINTLETGVAELFPAARRTEPTIINYDENNQLQILLQLLQILLQLLQKL